MSTNIIFVEKVSKNVDFALAFKKAKAEKAAKAVKAKAAAEVTRKKAAEAVKAAWQHLLAKVDNTKALNVILSAREAGRAMKYFLVTGRKIAAVTKIEEGKAAKAPSFDFDLQMFAGDQEEGDYLEGFQFHMGSPEVRGDIALDWWDDSRLIEEDLGITGDPCDVRREDANNIDNFDLQLFAAGKELIMNKHLNNKRYIEAIKSHEGNGLCYRFTAISTDSGVRFVLDTTSAEITPLTRNFLQTNGVFQNLCCREMIAKRGFSGYVVLDLSNIATSSNPKLQAASTFYFAADYYLGKDENGKTVIAVRIPKNDKFYVVSESRVNGKFRELKRSDIYDSNGIKDGWMRFKSNKLASASKGRKIMADMFAEDSKFVDILDEATFGEFKAVEGMMLTNKGMADKWTRIGSKSTRMGSMYIMVENYIIRLVEDGATDGSYEIAARKMAEAVTDELGIEVTAKLEKECLGYILQARPYTGKGAGETKSDKNMAEHAKLEKIYVIRKESMTDRDKQILAMFTDKELRKAAGIKLGDDSTYPVELKGYTAIGVIGNDLYGWDLIGDLNFYKDQWDFTRTSGMNVLAVAHYEQEEGFKNAFTSGQMMKVVLRAVNEANDKDLAKKFDTVMKSIIDDNIAGKLDFNKSVQNFRADRKFDLSFPGRDYMTINPTTWRNSIATHQMVITQMINSVGDMINRDRYAVPGHSV